MVLKTFFLLISALSFTSSQQMTCDYSISDDMFDNNRYQCVLNINNPNGLDNAISIGGVHLGSYTDQNGNQVSTYNDSSVQIVRIVGLTKNIPSAICRQFPNTELLDFSNSGIQIVSSTKCSRATELRLSYNLIEQVTVDLCQFQPALENILIENNNKLKVISSAALKSCKNLLMFSIDSSQVSALSSTLFANTSIINSIGISGNIISVIPDGLFNGLTELTAIVMRNLPITDLPLNIFSSASKLEFLSIGNNTFTQIRSEWSQNLKALTQLYLSYTRVPIPANFFLPMKSLVFLNMDNCNISAVNPQWFSTLTSLFSLVLSGNNINAIPDNTFNLAINGTKGLKTLDLSQNKLKTISSKWFSNTTLQYIYDINLDDNEINAIDPLFFDLAKSMSTFSLNNNKCYTGPKITNFVTKRSLYMPGFKTCIDNFAAIKNW